MLPSLSSIQEPSIFHFRSLILPLSGALCLLSTLFHQGILPCWMLIQQLCSTSILALWQPPAKVIQYSPANIPIPEQEKRQSAL